MLEARWCREARARGAAFSERKWGPESPQLESETGMDTGTEWNGLEGSGPSELCITLRNCGRALVTKAPERPLPQNPLSLPQWPEQTSGFGYPLSLRLWAHQLFLSPSRGLTSSRLWTSVILRWEVAGGV